MVPGQGTTSACTTGRQNVNIQLIHYFSSHPVTFGFWISSPQDYITCNLAKKMTDHSLFQFQTGTGPAAHAISDTE